MYLKYAFIYFGDNVIRTTRILVAIKIYTLGHYSCWSYDIPDLILQREQKDD
jgi:hypothetical protein